MRVLLTGAGGFSGASLVPALLAAGHELVAVAGRSLGRLAGFASDPPRLTILSGDLAGGLALPQGIEAIVHAAALSPAPGVCVRDLVRNNVEATARLAAHGRECGIAKFVFFSSLSVYGEIAPGVVDENSPIVDPDAYGQTKLLSEAMLADEPYPTVSLRLPGVIGRGSVRNWLTAVLAAAKAGREIAYYNPDAPYNNAVHAGELADFVVTLLGRDWRGHERLTLGAAGTMPVREVVEAVVRATGGRSGLRVVAPQKAAFLVSSARAIERGYAPSDIRAMLARFLRENA